MARGRPWVADYYHRSLGIFNSSGEYVSQPLAATEEPEPHTGPLDDPCGLALDSSLTLYANNYHRDVARFPLSFSTFSYSLETGAALPGSEGATGVAVDPATDHVYVDVGDHVAEYDASGAAVQQIGAASLGDGYGIAVSGYPGTAGYLYLPDASNDTVKVYDPGTDTDNPIETITGPPGGFSSLRDASVVVDDVSGEVYVLDNTQPSYTEEPRGRIHVFDSAGAYEGHLKYDVIDGSPSGLAVDNSGESTQGRVYVTTGNANQAGIYVYPPGAATNSAPLAPKFHPPLPGSMLLFPTVSIGGPGGAANDCEGDACQVVPSPPGDPTLTTLLSGHGNPKVRYINSIRNCGARAKQAKRLARSSKRLARRAKRAKKGAGAMAKRAGKLRRRAKRTSRAAKRCRRAAKKGSKGGASASASAAVPSAPVVPSTSPSAPAAGSSSPSSSESGSTSSSSAPTTQGLLPGSAGFAAAAWADGGGTATQAGSHPYQLDLSLGLDPGSDLRSASFTLPPGLLLDPANGTGVLCRDGDFSIHRVTPFAAGSESGESCPDMSQVGTIEVTSAAGGGKTRSFGLFNRPPDGGTAAKFGAAPFGYPLEFSTKINADVPGAYMTLEASEIPQAMALEGMKVSLWGVPWDASHNTERGNCLNEEDPAFARGKCSVGDPTTTKPRAFITLPTACGAPLTFQSTVGSWQQPGTRERERIRRGPRSPTALRWNSTTSRAASSPSARPPRPPASTTSSTTTTPARWTRAGAPARWSRRSSWRCPKA